MDDGSFAHPLHKLRSQPAPDVSKLPSLQKAPTLDAAGLLPPSTFAQNPSDGYVFQYDATQQRPVWASKTTLGYGTSLPGSPADGDEYILVDNASTPTYQWRFRYHSGSGNTDKWEFEGGNPVLVEVTTAETTASTTYAALTTAGPSFTLPRAGVYLVEIGCRATNASSADMSMSYDIGASGASDNDRTDAGASGANQIVTMSRAMPKTGLTAVALVSKYKTSAGTATFERRWMRVVPVRVS